VANSRKALKSLPRAALAAKRLISLTFAKTACGTPCLPAKFDPRVGTSCKPKNHKHFIVATMLSVTGASTSQPNSNSRRFFLSKWRSLRLCAPEVTFPSDTLTRRVSTMPRARSLNESLRNGDLSAAVPGQLGKIRLSPDGKQLACVVGKSYRTETWVLERQGDSAYLARSNRGSSPVAVVDNRSSVPRHDCPYSVSC